MQSSVIGKIVTVTVDRPMGSYHPEHKDMYYPVNYGYIEGIIAPDGEEQDAYLSSANAVIDGSEKRYLKTLEMLLNDIENNTATITSTADFHLTNDGVSWKLDDSNTTIGNAIFGTLSSSPVNEETAK